MDRCQSEVLAKLDQPASEIVADDLLAFIESHKPFLKVLETDVRDAKRRVQNAKGPPKRKAPAAESGSDGGSASD